MPVHAKRGTTRRVCPSTYATAKVICEVRTALRAVTVLDIEPEGWLERANASTR
jgi:hypothetical protein